MSTSEPTRVACPGSFDPVTNGHLDIIGRASRLYDEVIVAVLINESKHGLFSHTERMEMLAEVTKTLENVRVVVRGLRAVTDFDYELKMAQMNYGLSGLETLFMPTNPLYSFVSSSLIKDVAKWGGDVSAHVPEVVSARLTERISELHPRSAGG